MKLGVTGGMGCGKTTLCAKVVAYAREQGLDITLTDADDVRRDILGMNPRYADVRTRLAHELELEMHEDGIDRRALSAAIFGDETKLATFDQRMDGPILTEIYDRLARPGRHLLDWALLIEKEGLPLVNYNVVLVTCNPAVQRSRIFGGDLSDDQVRARLAHQFSNAERRTRILAAQHLVGFGTLLEVDTTYGIVEDDVRNVLRALEGRR